MIVFLSQNEIFFQFSFEYSNLSRCLI